jgi:amino acid transporter
VSKVRAIFNLENFEEIIPLTRRTGYGEAEFVFSIIKVIAVVAFIILGIIIDCGGVPGDDRGYLGARTWYEPGAFNNGFKGLCSVFITAAFAFSGTELVGLAAAETQNPRIELPKAIKQVFWRILLFYMVSLTIAGLLVPYDDPRLLGSSDTDANASPFVIAIRDGKWPLDSCNLSNNQKTQLTTPLTAGIAGLPSVMNAVILIAVLSVGNSSIYASSRTLAALAEQGQAPKSFGYIDRSGRPLVSILVSSAFGLLCFVVAAGDNAQSEAFTWMLAISGLSLILAWLSVCLCHIRFRAAWKKQGRRLDELAFKSQTGVVGSYIGLIFNCLVLVAQFWIGAWPIGYGEMSAGEQVLNFFQAYLAAPIVILCYVGFKVWKKTSIQRAATIDITTGTREIDLPRILEEERLERMSWPAWKRWYRFFC